MEAFMSRYAAQIYAVFRMVVGALFLQHGMQKLFGVLQHLKPEERHPQPEPWTQGWIGGVIELVCGVAVLVGFGTRWAAFLASGTMAVAYFQFHQPRGGLPIQNDGELAVLYCFAFLLICAKGHGIWSVSGRSKST